MIVCAKVGIMLQGCKCEPHFSPRRGAELAFCCDSFGGGALFSQFLFVSLYVASFADIQKHNILKPSKRIEKLCVEF